MNHSRVGIKTLTTVADEALVALILENNLEEWLVIVAGGEIQKHARLTLYTHGGKSGKATKKGWSLDGRKRYNTIHSEVKEVRNEDSFSRVDQELKTLWTMELKKPVQDVEDANGDGLVEDDDGDFEPAFDFDD